MAFDHQTLRQYEAAIEAAAADGNEQAALEIAGELYKLMGDRGIKPAPRYNVGQAGMPQEIENVARSASLPNQIAAGVGTVLPRAYEGIAGLFGGGNPANKQNLDALAGASPGTISGSLGGNVGLGVAYPPNMATTATRMAMPRVPGWLASRPGQVGDVAGTAAGVNAAIEPGTTGDRLLAGGLGSTAGVVAPAAVAGGQILRRGTTTAGRQIKVGENISRELNGDTQGLINALRAPNQMDQLLGTRSSAHMATENPTLRVLESGSRAKRGDLWSEFDRSMGDARWEALQGRAGTPEQLATEKATRDARTGPMRDQALGTASFAVRQQLGDVPQMDGLMARLEALQTHEHRPNPAVQTMVNYVRGQLEQGASPSQLYTVRKMLTDGIANAPTSDLSQAARAARPQRMEIIGAIDDVIDDLSGGRWRQYMNTYQQESPGITSRESLQRMAEALRRGQPEGITPPILGERPGAATVGRLRDQHGQKQFGSQTLDRLLPEDRQHVEALINSLRLQGSGMVAPGILGSHTAPLLANMGRTDTVTSRAVGALANAKIPGGSMLTSRLFDAAGRRAEDELARLLQNPDELAQALERAARAQALLQGTSRVGSGAGMGASGVSQ